MTASRLVGKTERSGTVDVWGVVNLLISPLDGSACLAALRMEKHLEHWVGLTGSADAVQNDLLALSRVCRQ
jgi:hypothetical protein